MAAVLMGLGAWTAPAEAAADIQADLPTQAMHARRDCGAAHEWAVSTVHRGCMTPNGRYGMPSLQAMHHSEEYHNSPMPHRIFFHGGYAIRGTCETALSLQI